MPVEKEDKSVRRNLDLLKEMLTGGGGGGGNVKMRHRAKRKSSSADARMRHSLHGVPEQW